MIVTGQSRATSRSRPTVPEEYLRHSRGCGIVAFASRQCNGHTSRRSRFRRMNEEWVKWFPENPPARQAPTRSSASLGCLHRCLLWIARGLRYSFPLRRCFGRPIENISDADIDDERARSQAARPQGRVRLRRFSSRPGRGDGRRCSPAVMCWRSCRRVRANRCATRCRRWSWAGSPSSCRRWWR